MAANHLAQVSLQFFDCSVAFALVARRDNEDEGFGLGSGLEEFVDQTRSDSEAQATVALSIDSTETWYRSTNLFAPVTRT